MVSRQDVQKRQVWEVRFRQFRASGLSVAQFCQQQRVSIHTFYYWAKRIGSNSAETSSPGPDNASRRSRPTVQHAPTVGGISGAALVRFSWNAGVEVSVPAGCLDAIRCLAECLGHTRVERSDAFQEVIVSS